MRVFAADAKMKHDNRRLLGSHSQHHDDGRVVCRIYYLTPDHWQTVRDGVSPLPATVDQVNDAALAYASKHTGKAMQVSSAKLGSSAVEGVGELHHYIIETAPVGTPTFLPASFVEEGVQVLSISPVGSSSLNCTSSPTPTDMMRSWTSSMAASFCDVCHHHAHVSQGLARDCETVRRQEKQFVAHWKSLGEPHRRFLMEAYEMGRPRSVGLDVVVAHLEGRAVGATCGMTASESDDTARKLLEWGWIRVLDSEKRRFGFNDPHKMERIVHPQPGRWWRLWWEWVFPLATAAGLLVAFKYLWP